MPPVPLPPLVPDSGPLFSLAGAGELKLLDAFELLVTDVVWMETAGRASHPKASREAMAIEQYLKGNARCAVVPTQVGSLAHAHGLAPNLGELSIQVVCSTWPGRPRPMWVLFEDRWFQARQAHFPGNVALLGTHAFLIAAERLQLIASAAIVLKHIQDAGRSINTPAKALKRKALPGTPPRKR